MAAFESVKSFRKERAYVVRWLMSCLCLAPKMFESGTYNLGSKGGIFCQGQYVSPQWEVHWEPFTKAFRQSPIAKTSMLQKKALTFFRKADLQSAKTQRK